ncbi:MAG: cytochrome b/b6 domain-containing protein, partial [Mariprofundaceae bacterium]|nr:cytochrome b/b6 domain-containing protein [Mariprofundaceae bacterium]
MMANSQVVWSLFIRIFHWILVILFILAYITSSTGDDDWHMILGYGVTLLLIARIFYGFLSRGYGKFSQFMYSPMVVWMHVKGIFQGRPAHYEGHSPAGSVMVFALIGGLLLLVTAGLLYQAWGEYEGPLWWLNVMPSDGLAHQMWHLHKWLPDILIGFIVLHVLGVLLACIQHHENLVKAMFTGKKCKGE